MLNEHVFMIMNDRDEYFEMLDQLKTHYSSVNTFYDIGSFIRSIEFLSQNQNYMDNNLFIIFSEYDFLNEIYKYTNTNLDIANYILVSFNSIPHPSILELENVFDSFVTSSSSHDYQFFLKRLKSEIANKNRISLLKQEMSEFYEIGKQLSSEKDTIKLFETIALSSLKMTSSDAVSVFLIIDSNTGLWSSIGSEINADRMLKFVISKNQSIRIDLEDNSFMPITKKSIAGYTAISGKSLRIDDAYNINPVMEYQHNKSFDDRTGFKTKSILSVPMKDHNNRVTGVIQLLNKKKTKSVIDYSCVEALNKIIPYDYADELIMNSVAGQAAVALDNNLLYQDMEGLLHKYKLQNEKLSILSSKVLKAHEEERKRIAREIHDGPAQSAACLALKLELCKRHFQKQDFINLENELDKLGNDIRSNVKEIRSIIYDLKPSYLEDGLVEALKNHISIFQDNHDINVCFQVTGSDSKIEYYLVSTLYRVVQEALSNCLKHANATKILIELNIADESLKLKITDNGIGFDIASLKDKKNNRLEGGFGLEGMIERIELAKGEISIKSQPRNGTSIEVFVPLQLLTQK